MANINLPQYFMEWINLKDVYLNFYGREVSWILLLCLILVYVYHKFISWWINMTGQRNGVNDEAMWNKAHGKPPSRH